MNRTFENIAVILVRPAIPGNIGAVARAMANFGFSRLIIVDSKCKIDEEARKRAKHAQKILDDAVFEKTLKKAISEFGISVGTTGVLGSDYNIARSPVVVESAAEKVKSVNGSVALVFGAEDAGLSNEELQMCDFTSTIPSSKNYPVLNLSHAVSIFLYEISKKENSENLKKGFPLAEGGEKKALENAMNSAIESVKYRTVFEKRTQKLVWKKILGKATPTKREAFAMIGLLKKLSGRETEHIKNKKIKRNKVNQESKHKKTANKK